MQNFAAQVIVTVDLIALPLRASSNTAVTATQQSFEKTDGGVLRAACACDPR